MAHQLMLHGHPVGYLPPTYASEILTSDGKTVEEKITWTTLDTIDSGNNINVSNYKNLNIIPRVNGSITYNPFFASNVGDGIIYLNLYQDATHYWNGYLSISNGVATYTSSACVGWSKVSLTISGQE